MPISHLFNLAKALLGKKKIVPEKLMSYSKAFRHPHTESVFKRALSSQDSSWSKLADLLGQVAALSGPMDRCTAVLLWAPTSPFWLCVKVRMHWHPRSAPWLACGAYKGMPAVKGARWGKKRGAGPHRHPAQGLKPSVKLCSEKHYSEWLLACCCPLEIPAATRVGMFLWGYLKMRPLYLRPIVL